MTKSIRKFWIMVIAAAVFLVVPLMSGDSGGPPGSGGTAFASVGSVAEGEDISYNKAGGVLNSLGFDTTKMPATYDADATTNPYGSDVTTMNEVEEVVRFDKASDGDDTERANLFGHNAALDGSFATLMDSKKVKEIDKDFLKDQSFLAAVKCDLNGDGRDSAMAIVYTPYNYEKEKAAPQGQTVDHNIYLRFYDPAEGTVSEPKTIATLADDCVILDYLLQSQMQITAGDYDKDAVDEIAVYVPAADNSKRSRVLILDLTDGKDCENPFSLDSWREAWNYILPLSQQDVVKSGRIDGNTYLFKKNVYNNIDLSSGDADNDGICDLVVSYGASDTDYSRPQAFTEQAIVRSIPSTSVLLYGNDEGQMLRESQKLPYGDSELIRVSVAFGDVDGDGNEDMFFGGQLKSEQKNNETRVLGKYIYDGEDGGMSLESVSNNKVVNGSMDGSGHFCSANGWDRDYNSAPLMKANLIVGDIMGPDSNTKIYLDSVLYSYDSGNFEIQDELEDASTTDSAHTKHKGSCVFTDMKKGYYGESNVDAVYYEFGGDTGDFTGSMNDNFLVNRTTIRKKFDSSSDNNKEGRTSILYSQLKDGKMELKAQHTSHEFKDDYLGAPAMLATVDSDKDSMVATYTGEHEITYQKPKVLAVLASAPYFKDVADYDEGDMLNWCSTSYGTSSGSTSGFTATYDTNIGVFSNIQLGTEAFHFIVNGSAGYAREETWGHEDENVFEIDYDTAGGEDAVVLYSTPSENYRYILQGVTVDDDGNYKPFKRELMLARPHKPVPQVMTLDDYMDVQARYDKSLPDVTKYMTSTPGYPETYPHNDKDLSKAAKDKLGKVKTGDDWSGISFGSGTETQSITYSHTETAAKDNVLRGTYGSLEVGVGSDEQFLIFSSVEVGIGFEESLLEGNTYSTLSGVSCSGTVANMPRAAKGYGYDFSWKLFKYEVKDDHGTFPVISYIVDDVSSPPNLPENIEQDFEKTTDSQVALTWDYSRGDPQKFEIYRYEDFPQGGGDTLVGTVAGSDYRIKKDDNGNTIKDKDGHVIREYNFTDTDLTADTKYQYRMKVFTEKRPPESIFSPVIEGRTFVGTKPDIYLSADQLTIYPDSTYDLLAKLRDPEHYQSNISYQWQLYNEKKRKWEDIEGCDKSKLQFYNCSEDDEGKYRCRFNLIRKVESHPQYITAYTDPCTVKFSLRDVGFGGIQVYRGNGNSDTNTGLQVPIFNTSETSLEKPTGTVRFTITGPNGTFEVLAGIDEDKGVAKVDSIEDRLDSTDQEKFVDGGYLIKARYEGNAIFYAKDDPEDYHYLRNIDESIFLSVRSEYYFGDDVAETAKLMDYKVDKSGKVEGTDITDKMNVLKFYSVGSDGSSKETLVATCDLSQTDGKALLPLDKRLAKKAYIEAYMEGKDDPVANYVVTTRKINVTMDVKDKMTGTGDLLKPVDSGDVQISDDIDADEENIVVEGGANKSLSDYMLFKYFESSGDEVCSSDNFNDHKTDFIPAEYNVVLSLKDDDSNLVSTFYKAGFKGAAYTVVGNYYLVSASAKDPNTGSVAMISPDQMTDFTDQGYAGGTKLTLKALPDKGYTVRRWIINECGNEYTVPGDEKITYSVKSQSTGGDGKVTIKAVMEPKNNTLKYESRGSGTVTLAQPIGSGDTVLADTRLDFTATPDPGWTFKEWRWTNNGGDNTVTTGNPQDDGKNTKTFTMPDNSAELYGIFFRETIDVGLLGDLEASYINDGSNPLEEVGKEIPTDKGRAVPKGTEVIVRAKPGIVIPDEYNFEVSVSDETGPVQVNVEEFVQQGRRGCRFTLPANVTGCSVTAITSKGKYSVIAAAQDVDFSIKVDGNPMTMTDNTVSGIESGSQVEVSARPTRGKLMDKWLVNGEEVANKDNTYTVNITENLNVGATTKADTKHKLTLATDGGGKAKYEITDKNGDKITGTFQGAAVDVDVYKGESAVFGIADDDLDHTLTSLTVDGEQQELDEGKYTIKEIEKDTSVVCKFRPNTYYDILFTSSARMEEPIVLDEDGFPVSIGSVLKAAKGGDFEFSVVLDKGLHCVVRIFDNENKQGTKLTPVSQEDYGQNQVKYDFKLENVQKAERIDISDHDIKYIYNQGDLYEYFQALADNDESDEKLANQPDGVLMTDLPEVNYTGAPLPTPEKSVSAFDGGGYCIGQLKIGEENNYQKNFRGLFGNITPKGSVKDLQLVDMKVYAKTPSFNSDRGYGAMLAYTNYGTISNVAVVSADYHVTHSGSDKDPVGVITYDNHGLIENCLVRNTLIDVNDQDSEAYLGTPGAVYNTFKNTEPKGTMKGNYFEDNRIKAGSADEKPASMNFVAMIEGDYEDASHGTFDHNYFRSQESGATDGHGISVYTLAESLEEVKTAEFARKLAYTINDRVGDKVWGVYDNTDTEILQTRLDGRYKAPIKVEYVSNNMNLTQYLYPGDNVLPEGTDAPAIWIVGDKAYLPGQTVKLTKDMTIHGQGDLSGYVASLCDIDNGVNKNVRYYKNVKDAFADATADDSKDIPQELQIIGDCTLSDAEFTMSEEKTITVKAGVSFTMSKTAQITNKGNITVEAGSAFHKYGTIVNSGTIAIPENAFYNYGSEFTNTGSVNDQRNIICLPHCFGEWTYADHPDPDGYWPRTSTCSVCTNDVTERVEPNPPANRILSIEILDEPETTEFEVGDEFSDKGLVVIANLSDGTRAGITQYELALKDDKGENPIKNGDVLEEMTKGKIIVKYGAFRCSYDVSVLNTADLLTITDANGKEIKEKEMEPDQTLDLKASLKAKLPFKKDFMWQSSDPSVAGTSAPFGDTNKVTARNPGDATITVRVIDENGNPVENIDPKTVKISVVSHITDLKILGGDLSIDKGDQRELKTQIIPENTTDKVKWSTSDEDVCTVDENGVVTGTGGGDAVVTVEAPNGLSDSRKVHVFEKAKSLVLDPENLSVKTGGYNTVKAMVENPKANCEVTWSVPDTKTAGFYVKDEKTGEMKIADSVKTLLSGDGKGTSDAYVIIAGVKAGTVKVKAETEAEDGSIIEKECEVTVADSEDFVKITHNGAPVSGQLMTLEIEGQFIQLGAESSAAGDTFTWSVVDDNDDQVLKVNSNGRVQLLKKGQAVVKVTSDTTGAVDVCIIKVIISPTGVTLSDSILALEKGSSQTIGATLKPDDSEGTIKWSSSNEKVAVVDENGNVTAKETGEVVITAVPDSDGAKPATCKVTVYDIPVEVELSEKDIIVQRGSEAVLKATIDPAGAKGKVVWSSSNPSVATVTDGGTVKGIKEGTAVITADFSKPGSKAATCKVTVCEPELRIKLSKTSFYYDKKVHVPNVSVWNGSKVFGKNMTESNSLVMLMFSGAKSKKPGTYKVTAIARDWHFGSASATYKIKIKPTKLKKVKNDKLKKKDKKKKNRTIIVKWKKVNKKYIKGYHIRYSLNKKMKKPQYKNVKKWNATKAKIKVKRGKKYYVQVRTYLQKGGVKYYSDWSKKKKIKVKK